ncbi:hypothetical protein EMIHUDRAFT_433305 [Emiliania huxleyi CCMP1516]|uniref:Uncharacterized protein n=2 Tax=Emiliania huxleyi TaxID=2903 RepID=A0A0D3KZX0_EMIH1|nr:hypothetical protein EMIHUDRAFT_433305 [Emiliania huxleyi CCMP1516]EOD41305.1 hypothetical protein EMIHUDRAFT_433305 [Emiliania huxleyi CCMP1516]|eukprot:XP_005793734.1 hypothetical protein EMIHUDRAFT_433305 [Emiliania huxleyi CCMP1516]
MAAIASQLAFVSSEAAMTARPSPERRQRDGRAPTETPRAPRLDNPALLDPARFETPLSGSATRRATCTPTSTCGRPSRTLGCCSTPPSPRSRGLATSTPPRSWRGGSGSCASEATRGASSSTSLTWPATRARLALDVSPRPAPRRARHATLTRRRDGCRRSLASSRRRLGGGPTPCGRGWTPCGWGCGSGAAAASRAPRGPAPRVGTRPWIGEGRGSGVGIERQ